jgi:hypothetical protein
MNRCLAMLLAVTLIGCATMGGAASLPSGDTKNWITYRVEVGDQVVQFAIPPGVNEEFLDPPVSQRIDLEQLGLFDQAGAGPRLLSRHWDYRKGSHGPIGGTLRAYIGLWYVETILNSSNALQAAVVESNELRRTKDVLQGGSGGPPDKISFEPAVLGGREALLVRHQTSPSNYAVTLDAHHYLLVYISGNYVTEPGWREDAKAAAEAILNSIRIEPKH